MADCKKCDLRICNEKLSKRNRELEKEIWDLKTAISLGERGLVPPYFDDETNKRIRCGDGQTEIW